jgi:hypothetical protein
MEQTSRACSGALATVCVDKMVRGAKPADLPVEQPTKFDLVVNLKNRRSTRVGDPGGVPPARRRGDRVTPFVP